MIHNNLKSKAKLILSYYGEEMDENTKSFYIRLSNDNYLKKDDKLTFLYCEFRYLANNCGLI